PTLSSLFLFFFFLRFHLKVIKQNDDIVGTFLNFQMEKCCHQVSRGKSLFCSRPFCMNCYQELARITNLHTRTLYKLLPGFRNMLKFIPVHDMT
uniref:Secreted protein n=1 Tax=Chelonoidis abingdonii TaxID=106734 RepID=A0A8C0J3T2_CHEAB